MNFVICPPHLDTIDLPLEGVHINTPMNLERTNFVRCDTYTCTGVPPTPSIEFHFNNDIEQWLFNRVEDRDTVYRLIMTRIKRNEDML